MSPWHGSERHHLGGNTLLLKASSIAVALVACLASVPAFAVDWASVPGKEQILFYPGQTSFEWILGADHDGAAKFKAGKNCAECHRDEAKSMGDLVVSGKKAEPNPIAGKPGSIPATIKVANDGKNLLVHIDFKAGPQPDVKMDKDDTIVTMILNDGGVPESNRMACWATCHEDLTGMPAAAGERSKYIKQAVVKLTAQGGGGAYKPAADLAALTAAGTTLEYWQARLNPGAKPVALSGTILDKRAEIGPNKVEADGTIGSVTFSRPLLAGAPYKDIVADKTYTVGFAIHAGHSKGRFHYVSFENTLVLDAGTADLVATKK